MWLRMHDFSMREGRRELLDQDQRWSLDFVSDALSDGRRFRILAVIDDFNRECVGLVADISLSGVRVACELDLIVSDNGTELTSNAILKWQEASPR